MPPDGDYLLPPAEGAASSLSPRGAPARWHMLAIYCGLAATNGFFWISFAPIESPVAKAFGTDAGAVDLLSTSFMILFLPGSVLSLYLLRSRWALRGNLLVSALLMAVGGVLRFAAHAMLGAWSSSTALAALELGQSTRPPRSPPTGSRSLTETGPSPSWSLPTSWAAASRRRCRR